MSRSLYIWKLKLCLAAAAAILASAIVPQRPAHEQHEQQAKDKNSKMQMVVDSHKAKVPANTVPTQARPPAAADSRDRLAAIL